MVWPCSRPIRSSFRLMVLHQSDLVLRSSCRGVFHWTQEGHLPAHGGSNGDRVGWSCGNALVGEFIFLSCLFSQCCTWQRTPISIFRWRHPSPIGLAVFPAHSLLIPIDGAPSIRPDLTFQAAVSCKRSNCNKIRTNHESRTSEV